MRDCVGACEEILALNSTHLRPNSHNKNMNKYVM